MFKTSLKASLKTWFKTWLNTWLKTWRISTFSGALLAAYFIPVWAVVAFRIVVLPIHGLFEQPNVSVALFVSDHLQLAAMAMVRVAWLLALGRVTVVAFFAVFLVSIIRASIRGRGASNEALAVAIAIGSIISFAGMAMASRVGEATALRLHATELLMLLGTATVMLCERPARSERPAAEAIPSAVPAPRQSPTLP